MAEASARTALKEEQMLASSDTEDADMALGIMVSVRGYVSELRPKFEASSAVEFSSEGLGGCPSLELPDCISTSAHLEHASIAADKPQYLKLTSLTRIPSRWETCAERT